MAWPHTSEFSWYDWAISWITDTSVKTEQVKGITFTSDNPDFPHWVEFTVSDLLESISYSTELWVDINWTVSEIKTEVEWVFWLWYELWNDWYVYYKFSPEYHTPSKIVIDNADKNTFKILWWWYAKDKNYVYHNWKVLTWISSNWFKYLSIEWGTMHNAYWIFWDFVNSKVIVNWNILEWANLWNFWYCSKLLCWTDWDIAVKRNYVVTKLTDREKILLNDSKLEYPEI